MPLPPSGSDIVNQIRSTAIAAADFGLRTNGLKANNITGAIQYKSSKPVGIKRRYILTLQEKLNNLVFDPALPSAYFNTINTLLANQPTPTIVTTTVTTGLKDYYATKGITLTPGTPILNLATTNQSGTEIFDIQQIEQINPGNNHYIYFSDTGPIQIGNTTIQITNTTPKKLRVTPNGGISTDNNFGDEITIDGQKFQFLGSGSGGLFIYKGRNYTILNTSNTDTTEVIDPTLNNIDGCGVDSLYNVYVCDYGNNRVFKYDRSANLISIFDTGFNNPRGIAVDSNDNVYVTNYDGNSLTKISAAGIITIDHYVGLDTAYGIYFKNNKFYVSCVGSIQILALNTGTGVITLFDSITVGFDNTMKFRGVVVDTLNNVYVSSQKTHQIYKINTLKEVSAYYSGLSKPNGLAIDSSNNLYVANSGGNNIIKITSLNTGSQFSVGHESPQGLAINSNILYITHKSGTLLKTINLIGSGGYAIPLNNIGFPINGTIKWICKNNKYSKDEFYVLINVADSTQNIDMIYRCSITIQGAIYTKVCDYSYGNYDFVYSFQQTDATYEYLYNGSWRTSYNDGNYSTKDSGRLSPYSEYGLHSRNLTDIFPERGYRSKVDNYSRYEYKYLRHGIYVTGYQTGRLNYRSTGNYVSFDPMELDIPRNPYRNRTTPKCMTSDASGNIYITNYGNQSEKDLPAVYKYDINAKQFSDFYVNLPYSDILHGIELIDNRYLFISNTSTKNIIGFDLESQQPNLVRFNVPISDPPTIITTTVNLESFPSTRIRRLHIFTLTKKKLIIEIRNDSYRTIDSINFLSSQSHTFGDDIYPDNLGIIGDYSNYFVGLESRETELYFSSGGFLYELYLTSTGTRGIRRYYDDVNFGRVTFITIDSNKILYAIGGNKNIFRLTSTPLSLNIILPKINIKQGFLPNIVSNSSINICDSNLNAVVKYDISLNFKINIGTDIFDNPKGIVKDSSGNLYVLSIGDKTIYKITDTTITPYISGLDSPNGGITITSNGTIYITNMNNTISKIFNDSTSFTASLSAPVGSVVTATVSSTANLTVGNVVQITDSSNPSNTGKFIILDIPSLTTFQFFNPEGFTSASVTCVNTSPIAQQFFDGRSGSLKYPTDLVIDNNGNMFILNKDGKSISKLVMSSLAFSQFTTEFSVICNGLVVDLSNNLYFLNQTDNSIGRVQSNGTVTSSFITEINNATDIYHENNKLYVLTTERKYYLINLGINPPLSNLNLLNNIPYIPATPVGSTTTITQPVRIPDGTEYINFVLIGGGGFGGSVTGGGSGAQLKVRIKVGSYDSNGTYQPYKNRRTFKFEVGKGGGRGGSKNGGDTKINFYNSDGLPSQQELIDLFVAGGGKSGDDGAGKGGRFPTIPLGEIQDFKIVTVSNNGFNYLTNYSNDRRRYVLEPTQINEGAGGEQYNFVELLGSMTGIDGLPGDDIFNIYSTGGDLNNHILDLDPNNTQLGPSNILNANFKKLSTTSSSNNFNLGFYPSGKGGNDNIPGNDGLVAWFFEGPSQYTLNTLHPGFRVPLSLMNQKFDSKWFTLPFKVVDSAIISTVDLNNSNNKTATFLCDTDGNITLVSGGSGYTINGDVKIKRSENSIFDPSDDVVITVKTIGATGNILTWSLFTGSSSATIRGNYNIIVPDGVTKVDVAMIGSGGSSGAFIREPLIRLTTTLIFQIRIHYESYEEFIKLSILVDGKFGRTNDNGFPVTITVQFYLYAGNYTLTEFVNTINRQIDDEFNRLQPYYQFLKFSFKALRPEVRLTPESFYYNVDYDTLSYYGFITDNLILKNFSYTYSSVGIELYRQNIVRSYTMQLIINNPTVGGEARIFYSPNMNNAYGIVHTYTKGTYDYTERIINNLPMGGGTYVEPTRTAIYNFGPNPINQLGNSEYVARVYFPFNLHDHPNVIRPSLTTDILTDEELIRPLPSFDGGDGSPGEYKRTTLNVIPGDILEIKVGGSVNSTIIPRTLVNNSSFTYGVSNVLPGKETYIQVSNRASTRITARGGLGGLPHSRTYAGKPGLPPNSFVYPTPTSGLLPPGWQNGYGSGGRTARDTNQYDNPVLRSSNGCAMIKFS